jgi:hypothetical protein
MALSLQDQLAQKIKDLHPNAEVKKINKDNFLDIHIPSIHPKRGTHLFFNTSKDLIKIGFYCREEDFIDDAINSSDQIEKYSQGLRLHGNHQFSSIDDAVNNAVQSMAAQSGGKKKKKTRKFRLTKKNKTKGNKK